LTSIQMPCRLCNAQIAATHCQSSQQIKHAGLNEKWALTPIFLPFTDACRERGYLANRLEPRTLQCRPANQK